MTSQAAHRVAPTDLERSASADAERAARVLLARISEPEDPAVHRLLAETGDPVEAVAGLRAGHPKALASRLAARLERAEDADDTFIAERLGARILIPSDPDWPPGLLDLQMPPHCLWVLGPVALAPALRRSVALVGARAATAYGLDRAQEIAGGLVDRHFTIVSGAAFGIDAAAHAGVLATDGVTIAVLACGIDRVYPTAHARLISTIAQTGAVVTELPPGSAPYRMRFLQRNRLIAAMTGGTVVIEAALRSGSLQTAARAADLGRPVGAVPGPVTSMPSSGCHQAIRDQLATLVTDAAEVADLVGGFGVDAVERPREPPRPEDALSPAQRAVFQVLPMGRSASVEMLAERAALDVLSVQASLGPLELAGLARRSGERWLRS